MPTNPEVFRDQHALLEYIEEHDLTYAWEGMSSFSYRLRTLAPGQYEIVQVRPSGALRALCCSRRQSYARSGKPTRHCAKLLP